MSTSPQPPEHTAAKFRPARHRFEVPPEPRDSTVSGARATPAPWEHSAPRYASHPVQTGFLLTVGVGIALLGYYVLTNVGGLVGWVVTAAFIALGLDPVVRYLEGRGLPRPLAVSAVILALALVAATFILLAVPRMIAQAQELVANIPTLVTEFIATPLFATVDERLNIASAFERSVESLRGQFLSDQAPLGGMFGSVVSVGGVVVNLVTGTLIVMALTLYFLFSLPTITAWFYRLVPATRRARARHLGDRMINGVGNYVVGQACVAILNAVVALLLMMITGVPYATLLVLLVAALAFVPLVGGVAAGILVTAVAGFAGWDTALPYAVCYFVYLQIEAYFISPRIMARAVAVPGAVAVIAVAGGGALWGVLGALIAVPAAAAGLLLVREVFVPRQDAR